MFESMSMTMNDKLALTITSEQTGIMHVFLIIYPS